MFLRTRARGSIATDARIDLRPSCFRACARTGGLPALWLTLGLAAQSCATKSFEERPLDPVGALEDFSARRLDAPDLSTFLSANRGSEAAVPWDLEGLTLVAFFYRRELDVARAEAAVARATVTSAGTRPNPTLAVDPEVAPGATHPWVLGFTLDLPIETANKRGLRVRAAEARAAVADLDLARTAWDVRTSVRDALAELQSARTDLELLEAALVARGEHVEALRGLLASGSAASPELLRDEQELARLRAERERGATRGDLARARLAEAVGLPETALAGVTIADAAPTPWPDASDAGHVRELGLTNRIELRAGLLEYAAAEADLRLELARQTPDLNLAPGTSWDQGDHKYAIGFALELPLFHRNEGPIAEAEARRAASGARFLARQEALIGAIEHARLAYLGALREEAAAVEEFDLAMRGEERVRLALAAGQVDRLSVLEARLARLALARARAERAADVRRALGALEDQLQRPLDGDPPAPAPVPPPADSKP